MIRAAKTGPHTLLAQSKDDPRRDFKKKCQLNILIQEKILVYVKGRSLLFLESFIQLCAFPPPTPTIFHFFPLSALLAPTVNCWLIRRSLLRGKKTSFEIMSYVCRYVQFER